jgi:hypothetical protein
MKLPLIESLKDLNPQDKKLLMSLSSAFIVTASLLVVVSSCAIIDIRMRNERNIRDCRSLSVNNVNSTDTLDLICGKLTQ